MQELLIETIRTDGVQSRAAVDRDYVRDLAEAIKSGKRLPPIDVYKHGGEVWAADGLHRLLAHQDAGKRTIKAEIHKGGKGDAMWHSAGANASHGLRRTNADKRHAVEMALRLRPDASDALVADHCGVSVNTVTSTRRQLPQIGGVTARTGKDGVTRQLPQIGGVTARTGKDGVTSRLPPPPPPRKPAPPHTNPPQPAKRQDVADKPASKPEAAEAVLDRVGRPIPDHLRRLFGRGHEVSRLLSMISDVRGAVRAAEDDPLWAECNRQSVESALAQAYADVKATIPHAVCPWCGGRVPMQADCRACGGRGALGEHRWNTIVPEDMKP